MAHDLLFTNETEWYAQDLRALFDLFEEGIIGSASLEVTDGATGLSIDVAAGSALIASDEAGDQGKYRVNLDTPRNSEAFVGGGIDPADATNPRVDRIVARVYDDEIDGTGTTAFRLEVVTGTPTAGATLANNNGIAALPSSSLALARVLIEPSDTSVNPANIADDRVVSEVGIDLTETLPEREDLDFDTPSLAAGEEYASLNLGLYHSVRLMRFESDVPCRFRLYMSNADRLADAARPIGTDPTGDHGLICEIVTTAGELVFRLSPQVDASNLVAPVPGPYSNIYYVAIENMSGATNVVNCTLTYIRTER